MSDILWSWSQGNTRHYTRDFAVALEAMQQGYIITAVKQKPVVINRNT